MSMFAVMDIAGSAISAQTARMNTISSNLANAQSASGNPDETYRAKKVIFESLLMDATRGREAKSLGVKINGVVESQKELTMAYEPNHPKANSEGYVYYSNVSPIEEMAGMLSASRAIENNVNMASTVKTLMQQVLKMGQ